MPKTKQRLIIIDGNALIHRSFHALPPTLRTQKGVLVNAVYGFASFLLKALNEFNPEYVVLTLDKKGPTFRHEAYTEYKATRVKAPDELYEQIPLVKEVATAFNIPIFELSGFEADDLIGTICEKTKKEKNLEKIIITGDLDTLQLIDENTKVYTMSRGLNDSVLYDSLAVYARYHLAPEQIIDYKALRGDVSDNIPGVRGIGEKTASDLISEFKDLNGVYKAAKENHKNIKPRIIELLKASQKNAYLSQELATINKKAPIEFSLQKITFSSFSSDKVLKIFSELEFKSLLPKVKALREKTDKTEIDPNKNLASKEKISNYELIIDERDFISFLEKLEKQKEFSFSVLASDPDPLKSTLIGLAFSWKAGEAFFIKTNKENLKLLHPILNNPEIKKNGHNVKHSWRILKNNNLNLEGISFDVMIASYLLNPGNRQHNLESIAFNDLGLEKMNSQDTKKTEATQLSLNFKEIDLEKISLYACEEADFINRLTKILKKRLQEEDLWGLFNEMEMPLIKVLGQMEENGIKLSLPLISNLRKIVGEKITKLEKNIYQLAGEKFNINSTKQLKEILFVKLEISTNNIKKTKTGFSTAEDELEKLENNHPIIPFLREYRELNKLQTTYLNALGEMISPKTGRIHTNFNQTVTATGRLSSSDPNLQNIPIKTKEGQEIREAFVASPGYKLLGLDYSQIELRLAAHLSGDKKLIKAFKNNEDIHTATAAEINDVSLKEVTKKMRREAKAINFGILYGQGPHGLSQAASIPYYQANEFIKKYFLAYPSIKKMIEKTIKEAQKNSYAITLFGRKRPLPEINSNLVFVRKSAERMATNTPLQGTAADMIKIAMIKVSQLISGKEDEIKMLLQVHDELIFEIKEDKLNFYAPKIKKIMENIIPLKVPIIVDENSGNNWDDLK